MAGAVTCAYCGAPHKHVCDVELMIEALRANRGQEPAENFMPKVRYRSEPGPTRPVGHTVSERGPLRSPVPPWPPAASLERWAQRASEEGRPVTAVMFRRLAWWAPQPPDPNPFPRIRLWRRRRAR
jgi:hypothetical protein